MQQLETAYRMIRQSVDGLGETEFWWEPAAGRWTALREDLAELTDSDLDRPCATNWGEQWPAWKIFWTMIQHDIHHGAEIGTLRDLYRVTRGVTASGVPS
jgi:hypothetical protein